MTADASPESMHAVASVLRPVPKPTGVPTSGITDVTLAIPMRLAVRLAAESLLTGRSADDLVADALERLLARDEAA